MAIVALTILAACGGSEGWGDSARAEFIAGCESSGNTNEICTCLQEKLEAEYPEADDPADFDTKTVVELSKECAG
jgi:hypothetical protein